MDFTPQHDQMDCGPACLSMIASYYGKKYPLEFIRKHSYLSREGVSILGINIAAKEIGFETLSSKLTIEDIIENKSALPCILHWNQNHFVVLKEIRKVLLGKDAVFNIVDPGHGIINLKKAQIEKHWVSDGENGVAIFLNPTDEFYSKKAEKIDSGSVKYLFKYLIPYRKKLVLVFLLLFIGSGLTLVLPFLTQRLIDNGVNKKNLNYINVILLAQLALFTGSIVVNILRNWLMVIIGTHLSIDIISQFLKKMLQLPISFFDTKMMGDFQQRIQDNDRIEEFLTSHSLLTFFSIITFSVFFGVLWFYDFRILIVYILLTILSIAWSLFWLRRRKVLDYFRFQQRSENQESIYEILHGVTEMKLNQFEEYKRINWKRIQLNLSKINIRILKIDQIQASGFEFINQAKNILVTFLAAYFVISDKMTLGALLSVSFIIGQMNGPVNQLIFFFRSLQDAKLSIARLDEVQNHPEEESPQLKTLSTGVTGINVYNGIRFSKVSFQYEGPKSPFALQDISFFIPNGKITAVVGASGSGKTTLVKLLLRFYDLIDGRIDFNGDDIMTLSPKSIRENCGVVMQDGYIFSDTIERNIATGSELIDIDRLKHAVEVANIESFIESLPLGYKTKIGAAGNGLSGGQKQRILIARAIYKDPHYIMFDEATSALDAENEKIIHDNLQTFFKGKTVIIIAHRLSTVKNADQILVLKQGTIVEQGNHEILVNKRGEYFNLVKNQLELGN